MPSKSAAPGHAVEAEALSDEMTSEYDARAGGLIRHSCFTSVMSFMVPTRITNTSFTESRLRVHGVTREIASEVPAAKAERFDPAVRGASSHFEGPRSRVGAENWLTLELHPDVHCLERAVAADYCFA